MTREEKIDKILDELLDDFIKAHLPLMTGMRLFAKVQNAVHHIETLSPKPCEDAISRQAVLDLVVANHTGLNVVMYSPLYKDIKQLSSVTPKPKTGHWIRMKAYEKWGCSECNKVFRFTFKEHYYCPNCGAKMEDGK